MTMVMRGVSFSRSGMVSSWMILGYIMMSISSSRVHAKSPLLAVPRKQNHPQHSTGTQQVIAAFPAASSTSTTATSMTIPHGGAAPLPKKKETAWQSGVKNSLASALAAACSKLILAPFDTIKTLQQHSRTVAAANPLSMTQAAQVILKRPKGFLELYAGIGVSVVGSMPSVGLYFGIYSFCKKRFTNMDPDAGSAKQTFYIALSAAIGNTIASASRVPYEVVKQKLQTQVYTSMGDAVKDFSIQTLFPTGGIASQMLRDIPYAIVTLLTYEYLKHVWKPRAQTQYPHVPMRTWDMLVGGIAGGVGSYATNPMDVIKTRLQTSSAVYGGSIRQCISTTLQEGGPSAFLRGSIPRLLHKVPANAFFFVFYELFRSILGVNDDPSSNSNNNNAATRTAKVANKTDNRRRGS